MATQISKDGKWKLEFGKLYEDQGDHWLFAWNARAGHIDDAVDELRNHLQGKMEENCSDRDLDLLERHGWW